MIPVLDNWFITRVAFEKRGDKEIKIPIIIGKADGERVRIVFIDKFDSVNLIIETKTRKFKIGKPHNRIKNISPSITKTILTGIVNLKYLSCHEKHKS